MAELTPMMRQYLEIKEKNKDCILFFRLGDFYEMFADDAKLVSKELDLTLTTRDRNKAIEDQVPMCGVPYHSAEAYIARLVAKGYKIAICEQTEDPAAAKGLVERDIVRIVTPGTLTESSMLDESKNNYIACIYGKYRKSTACAFAIFPPARFSQPAPKAQKRSAGLQRNLDVSPLLKSFLAAAAFMCPLWKKRFSSGSPAAWRMEKRNCFPFRQTRRFWKGISAKVWSSWGWAIGRP